MICIRQDSIYVIHSDRNWAWNADSSKYWHYQKWCRKEVDYLYTTEIDVLTNINYKQNESGYSEHHACVSWRSNQSPFIVRQETNKHLLISSVINIDFVDGDDLGEGYYPRAGNNSSSDALCFWSSNGFHGYRVPMDYESDIEVETYVTSKCRIHASTDIALSSNVLIVVFDTLILDDSSHLSLQSGSRILIMPGGKIYCGPGAGFTLDNATIEFEDSDDTLFLASPDALSGTGAVIGGTIRCADGLNFNSGDDISFSGGIRFSFACSGRRLGRTLRSAGTLSFSWAAEPYYFSECLNTILIAEGSLNVGPGAVLEHLPKVIGYAGTDIVSSGTGSNGCEWRFRDTCGLDTYGNLTGVRTLFTGTQLDSLSEWGGMVVAYGDSRLSLDSCSVRDIFKDGSNTAYGIVLYASNSEYNTVSNTSILRGGIGSWGDGVFLQPYGGVNSCLALACDSIDAGWWAGISSVAGDVYVLSTRILNARAGIGLSENAHAFLRRNCVEGHELYGLTGDGESWFFCGEYDQSPPENGLNRITGNDSAQVHLTNGSVIIAHTGTVEESGWHDNNIGHYDAGITRIVLDSLSGASVQLNWWGVIPAPDTASTGCELTPQQAASLFVAPNPSTILYNPTLCDSILPTCAIVCGEEEGGGGFGKRGALAKTGALPPHASSLLELVTYALENNFSEVYRFIASYLAGLGSPAQVPGVVMTLAHLERLHARRYPDSMQLCAGRLFPFISNRLGASQGGLRAALLEALARAHLLFGNMQDASACLGELRAQHPASPNARAVLPLVLQVEMAERDEQGMHDAIGEIEQRGFPEPQLRNARTMHQAYHRVLPEWAVRKKSIPPRLEDRVESPHAETFDLQCHPNPFNPSMTIGFTLREPMRVRLSIHDPLGRRVAILVDEYRIAGRHVETFTPSPSCPAGMYMVLVATERGSSARRILYVK